jgi:hypothetical protein
MYIPIYKYMHNICTYSYIHENKYRSIFITMHISIDIYKHIYTYVHECNVISIYAYIIKIELAMSNNFVCIPICPNFTMNLYLYLA